MNDNEILSLLCEAEREAARLILEAHDILAERKTDRRDVVTEYDRRVQELLITRITEVVPDARFFCEENDRHDDLRAEHVFIIDPIDGTMNFVHGLHHSCISAAYMSRGELRAAAICNPYVSEYFTAVKGAGAFLNGRPIRVTDAPLAETLVCCGTTPYNPDLADRCFALMKKAFLAGLRIACVFEVSGHLLLTVEIVGIKSHCLCAVCTDSHGFLIIHRDFKFVFIHPSFKA